MTRTMQRATALIALLACASAPWAGAAVDPAAPTQPLQVRIDLTDAPRQIYRVVEIIPVTAGELALRYPKWLPPYHSARGPIANVAGLRITAAGQPVPWARDPYDVYTLRATPPAGASEVRLSFVYVGAGAGQDQTYGESGTWSTRHLVDLPFHQVSFYPVGIDVRAIPVSPTVILPHGWQFATALDVASRDGDTVHFSEVPYGTFVDAPMIAGTHFARHRIGTIEGAPVHFDIVGDSAADVTLDPALLAQYRNVVTQLGKLFQSRHFRHYDLLLAVSRYLPPDNVEYPESSENRMQHDFLTSADEFLPNAYLLPHEMIHSWNGKFMRPAGMLTRDFATPEDNELIWVYEGLTQYWAA